MVHIGKGIQSFYTYPFALEAIVFGSRHRTNSGISDTPEDRLAPSCKSSMSPYAINILRGL